MSVSNYDASDVTRYRKARAMYAFKAANTAAVTASQSILPEQGPPPLQSERISRILGAGNLIRDGCVIHQGCACAPTTTCQGDTAPVGGQ
jgi:hypothetical protein